MEKLKTLFTALEKTQTIQQIEQIIFKYETTSKLQVLEIKYPRIKFDITPAEIAFLTEKNEIGMANLTTPLEKLMYAVLWKQGDLSKVKHIINGIISTASNEYNEPKTALVFHQFGRFLADKKEAIIDQHVLRAFAIYKADKDEKAKWYLENGEKNPKDIIQKYKNWLKDNHFSSDSDKMFLIDRLLMVVGKSYKHKQ